MEFAALQSDTHAITIHFLTADGDDDGLLTSITGMKGSQWSNPKREGT